MHRRIAVLLLVVSITFFCFRQESVVQAEVLDKIAAVVDGKIITLSDIRKERQILAVLGDNLESDDAVLKSMIDRQLLEEEMAQYPGLDVSEEEIDERMKAVTDLHGVALTDIRSAFSSEIQRYKYFSLRYGKFIVVSSEEIENYYNSNFVPEARRRGEAVPVLDKVADQIRANIFEEKLSRELETSLESLRARSNVEIL